MRRALFGLGVFVLVLFAWLTVEHLRSSPVSGDRALGRSTGRNSHHLNSNNLESLLNRPVPASNLWHLAGQVRLHRTTPIKHILRHRSPDYAVHHADTFWVLNANNNQYSHDRASIVCKSPHMYLYIQDSVDYNTESACQSTRHFEHKTYRLDRRTFGSEWTPGIDGDPHITVFFGHVPGVAGYYSGEDEYPRSVNRYSNQREMVFINSDYTTLGQASFDSTLAHEFQHMIHWHVHQQDEAWDNEGASMLAQVINGYPADGVDDAYATHPVQLDAWTDFSNSEPYYGAGFLWMDYLYGRFGASFIHAMIADHRYSGISLAQHVLTTRERLPLRKVFSDWTVASLLNRHKLRPVFGYKNSSVHVSSKRFMKKGRQQITERIHPYTPAYVGVPLRHSSRTVRLHGQASMPLISARSNGPFWWSNRCDFCDTSMTRRVDLQKGGQSRLTFKAWYQIERGYDYAYAEVSSDHGRTWRTVKMNISSGMNPNGANLGNGITGNSSRVAGNQKGWVSVHATLARFAGRKVLLRFEYVTDDEYNGQSLAIKDINIRGDDSDERVGSTAWRLSGFVPVRHNSLPLPWSVRVITFHSGKPLIGPLIRTKAGSSKIRLPSDRRANRATVVVFTQAPKTTLTARFTLSG